MRGVEWCCWWGAPQCKGVVGQGLTGHMGQEQRWSCNPLAMVAHSSQVVDAERAKERVRTATGSAGTCLRSSCHMVVVVGVEKQSRVRPPQ